MLAPCGQPKGSGWSRKGRWEPVPFVERRESHVPAVIDLPRESPKSRGISLSTGCVCRIWGAIRELGAARSTECIRDDEALTKATVFCQTDS